MSRHIKFYFEYCDDISIGTSIVTKDESIIFEPSPPISSFSVHPYDWSFELTTQMESTNKFLICYALASLCFLKCERASITIPKAKRGKVFIEIDFPGADGIYCSDYSPFTRQKYYDDQNKIYAVGNIAAIGKCIEFASGQFVVIDETGQLSAIYIHIN